MPAPTHALHVIDHPAHGHHPQARLTVVLVHGSLDRAASFARVVRRLPELHVVTYDRRGYAGSREGRPLATSLEAHVDDLLAVVGDGPAVVVGHSYGGDVALGAAIRDPERVRAVGAYEPPLAWLEWWPRRARNANEDPATFAEGFFRRMVGDAAWDRLPEATRAARRADGPALMAELTALRGDGPPFDVADLRVPAVFGRGEHSVWHHRQAVDELVTAVPTAMAVDVAGAAHGAHLTHPDSFASLVRAVVGRAT